MLTYLCRCTPEFTRTCMVTVCLMSLLRSYKEITFLINQSYTQCFQKCTQTARCSSFEQDYRRMNTIWSYIPSFVADARYLVLLNYIRRAQTLIVCCCFKSVASVFTPRCLSSTRFMVEFLVVVDICILIILSRLSQRAVLRRRNR